MNSFDAGWVAMCAAIATCVAVVAVCMTVVNVRAQTERTYQIQLVCGRDVAPEIRPNAACLSLVSPGKVAN